MARRMTVQVAVASAARLIPVADKVPRARANAAHRMTVQVVAASVVHPTVAPATDEV